MDFILNFQKIVFINSINCVSNGYLPTFSLEVFEFFLEEFLKFLIWDPGSGIHPTVARILEQMQSP